MAALHLVVRSAALGPCAEACAAEDAILLLQDGVYAAAAAGELPNAVFALEPDVAARGLAGRLPGAVAVASDADFVDLVIAHQPVVTWR